MRPTRPVDAAMTSGTAGAPVFNLSGELVGIAFQVLQMEGEGNLPTTNGHIVTPPVLHHFLNGIDIAGHRGIGVSQC